MTARDFAFWLQGAFEVTGATVLTAEQVDVIKRHLALVFVHEIDPSMGPPKKQAELNKVHSVSKDYWPGDPGKELMRC